MPRGSAFGSLSGISGTPVESENLTVTGVEPCTACCARVSDAAALDGVNVPVNKMPLAWPGLNPGCDPNMASNCFKISSLSAINFSSFGSGIVSLLLKSLIHLVRWPAQPWLACHAIAFGDGGSRRKSNEGG